VAIADGDTLTVLDSGNEQQKVRLAGIDTPEKAQPFGTASKQNLSALVFGKTVTVVFVKFDRYQKMVGKVLLGGQDVCLEQIKAGLAWHYKKYEREQSSEDRSRYAAKSLCF
jgi:endonuclease YncB( thermonuclease family)